METKKYNTADEELIVKRNYRDRLFRLVFEKEEALLELYNALNGTNYMDASELTVTTMDDVIYMNMKNDVSFMVAKTLNLYEHQSTWNPNMPLRDLFYLSKQYKRLVDEKMLYRSKAVKIPAPVCIMFYNGREEYDDVTELCLSDLYTTKKEEASLELVIKVYNINYGHNQNLMDTCRRMKEYALFVDKVKSYLREGENFIEDADYKIRLNYAINKAIDECIQEGILRDLLKSRRDEVKESMLTEYDEEAVLKMIGEEKYEDGYEDGVKYGISQGIRQGISQGKSQGEALAIKHIVKKMINNKFTWKQIEEMTGMTEEVWNRN